MNENNNILKLNNKKIILYVVIVLVLIIALITYFSTKMEKVDVGENLSLKYDNTLTVNLDDLKKDNYVVVKPIVIENKNSTSGYYSIVFTNVVNFNLDGELVVSAKCKSDGCKDINEIPIIKTDGENELVIGKNIYIDSNEKHEYDIIIEIKKDENTNEDEIKEVELELGVVEVKERLNQLIYDNQGGSGCTSKTIEVDKKYGELCTPTKPGYTFIGWYDKKTNGNKVGESTVLTVDDNQTIYAHYEQNEYTINFNTDGGSVCENKTVLMDSEYGSLCTPTKEGYTFIGWYDKETNGNKITNESILNKDGDKNLYSYWEANKYKVTFDNNTGSGCNNTTVTFDNVYGNLCTPVKVGYTFIGWFTDKDKGKQITKDNIVNTSSDQKLYAHWTPNKYMLTYNNPPGVGNETKEIIFDSKYGELYTPVRRGYTFLGWYETEIGGKEITSETVLTEDSNINIYSQWIANKYNITYDNNTGSGCTNKEVTFSNSYGNLCTPVKKGYIFTGWFTEVNGGKQITNETIVDIDMNHTLYAHWIVNTYNLVYNNSGGSGCSTKGVSFGEKYGSLCTPVRSGYTFDGWYNLNNEKVSEDDVLVDDADQVLTAHWIANEYLVTYDNNNGNGCINKNVTYDLPYGVLCEPSRVGYTFNGWYNEDDKIDSATIVKIPNNHTLKAMWQANMYTLNYNNTGGSGCVNKDVVYDSEYGSLCTPTKSGYTFIGWYTEEASGEKIDEETIVKIASTHTAYAHWQANEYTLTYDNNNGNGCTNKKVTYASSYGSLCTPTRVGYTFSGWYTNKTSGEVINEDDIFLEPNDKTIYAHWTANKYTLTYNNESGSGCLNKEITYDSPYGSLCVPIRTGYTFDGWYTGVDNGEEITENTILTDSNNKEVFAHWTANKYTITFNTNNGTGGTASIQATFDATLPEISIPTRENYSFKGYFDSTSGGTQYYDETGKGIGVFNIDSDVTFYARWQIDELLCSMIPTQLKCANLNTGLTDPALSYTGNCSYVCDSGGDENYRIKFLTSGTLTMNTPLNVDMFLVGGGGGGGGELGGGGGGGYTKTYKQQEIDKGVYSIQVGAGGSSGRSGEQSYFGNSTLYFANGGNLGATGNRDGRYGGAGGAGGSGGGGSHCDYCNNYGPGGPAFDCWGSQATGDGGPGRFGKAGGAGGSESCYVSGQNCGCTGGGAGAGQGTTTCEFGEGTLSGCNSGVSEYSKGGHPSSYNSNYLANSGNGGCGGGSGSSGIVIIRNPR